MLGLNKGTYINTLTSSLGPALNAEISNADPQVSNSTPEYIIILGSNWKLGSAEAQV